MPTMEEIAARLDRSADDIRPTILAELRRTGLSAEGKAKDFMSGDRLSVRTGNLRRSVQGGARELDAPEMFLRAGGGQSDVSYARIQEQGGTILPKRGRFLAIPVGPALTAAGVHRFASARDVPDLRFIPINGGAAGLLVKDIAGRGKAGRGARSEVWYRLVRRVDIRPKHYLRDAFQGATEGIRERLTARAAGVLRGE